MIGDAGEVVHIAEYAARFFEKHKRPLRIAVDEACWRFTNLTPEQVEKIREGEPVANPVEKTILWRVLRLMKLNVQLLFVRDGQKRPAKRGKRGGTRVEYELIRLLTQLLDHLKIPHHQAPGEAEAECARLQQEGIVDAVWSDDGDAFMFGCTSLIKQHKVDGKRIADHVRIFTADVLRQKLDFDADSFLLFALLSGGDYKTEGLPGCGPQLARRLARREWGLAAKARYVRQDHLPNWRQALELALRECGRSVAVHWSFPDFKALCNYRDPLVSSPEQLQNLRGLKHGWDRQIDQRKLRTILRDCFNMVTPTFLKHIAPVFLVRALARCTAEQRAHNVYYRITLKRIRQVKAADGEDAPAKAERKITLLPMPAVEIDLSLRPPEEDWTKFEDKDGTPYDPKVPIECEILDCFLQHGLPEGALISAPKPARKKRKAGSDTESAPGLKERGADGANLRARYSS